MSSARSSIHIFAPGLGGQFNSYSDPRHYPRPPSPSAGKEMELFESIWVKMRKGIDSSRPWYGLRIPCSRCFSIDCSCDDPELPVALFGSQTPCVLNRPPSRHTQDHQNCDDRDIASVTKLLQNLTLPPSAPQGRSPSPGVSLVSGPHDLPTQRPYSSSVPDQYVNHTPRRGDANTQHNNQGSSQQVSGAGQINAQDDDGEWEEEEESDQDQPENHPQTPVIASETTGNLLCPVRESFEYHGLDECTRCPTAKLDTMQSLAQHIRRTHYYCFKCNHKFPDREAFTAHTNNPQKTQCKKCHTMFDASHELEEHKREGSCVNRSRLPERARYKEMWKIFCPNQPCPKNYRVNQYHEYSTVIATMRLFPQDCIDTLLQESRRKLEQDPKINPMELSERINVVRRCLETMPETPNEVANAATVSGPPSKGDSSSECKPDHVRPQQENDEVSEGDTSFFDLLDNRVNMSQHEHDQALASNGKIPALPQDLPNSQSYFLGDFDSTLAGLTPFAGNPDQSQSGDSNYHAGWQFHQFIQPSTEPWNMAQAQRHPATPPNQSFESFATMPLQGHSPGNPMHGSMRSTSLYSDQQPFQYQGPSQSFSYARPVAYALDHDTGTSSSIDSGVNYPLNYNHVNHSAINNQGRRFSQPGDVPRIYGQDPHNAVSNISSSGAGPFPQQGNIEHPHFYNQTPAHQVYNNYPMPGDRMYVNSLQDQDQYQEQEQDHHANRPMKRARYQQ